MTYVLLGNAAPLMADGTPGTAGNTITHVGMRDDWRDEDVSRSACQTDNDPQLNAIRDVLDEHDHGLAVGVLEVNELWNSGGHSSDPPEWVESDDAELARCLSEWFESDSARVWNRYINFAGHQCSVGRPDDWDESLGMEARAALSAINQRVDFELISNPVGLPPIGGGAVDDWALGAFSEDYLDRWREHELLTTVGRDALHLQHIGGATAGAQPARFEYMAITANATAPSAADTTLTAEIATASGGLIRAQGTYAHTATTNVTTLTKTFTVNGNDTIPVTIAKEGTFNAASSGTLGYTSLLTPATATLSAVGDNCALTRTLTIG